jgi:trehalose-phosphatase
MKSERVSERNSAQGVADYAAGVSPGEPRIRNRDRVTAVPNFPAYALANWEQIRARVAASEKCALFLDFDGTLADFQADPEKVALPIRARAVLKRIMKHPQIFAAIVSGRTLADIQKRIDIEGLHHAGLHGGEMEGKTLKLPPKTLYALGQARKTAERRLKRILGIWIQDKGFSFAVHYRGAPGIAAESAGEIVREIVANSRERLRLQTGHDVLEILPREILGKSAAVEKMLRKLPVKTTAIYIGDDETDEAAFAVLSKQIAIRVGRKRDTKAHYYLRGTSDVLRFLTQLEKTLA